MVVYHAEREKLWILISWLLRSQLICINTVFKSGYNISGFSMIVLDLIYSINLLIRSSDQGLVLLLLNDIIIIAISFEKSVVVF